MNLRADDILFTPFALCFTLVLPDSATVFINKDRVPADVQEYLEKEGFAIAPYEETAASLRSIKTPVTFIIEKTSLSYALYQAMEENTNIMVKEGKGRSPTEKTALPWSVLPSTLRAAWQEKRP